MNGRARREASWPVLLGLLALVACRDPYVEVQPCPNLSYAKDVLYRLGGELVLGDQVESSLTATADQPRFVAHPFAVPLAGNVSVTLTLSGQGLPATASLYVYGPRGADGIFGTCVQQRVSKVTTVEVPEGGGGEWLVLVGADPVTDAAGDYTLAATCEGDGCDATSCPVLSTTCNVEVCADEFATATVDEVTCPICSCTETECSAFQSRVFDECVCDCQVPLNAASVCGTDGKTYTSACFAGCAQVGVANAGGACESVCSAAQNCTLDCPSGYRVEAGCPVCECAGGCDSVTAQWKPVCGSDGFTYTNKERLECETDGVSVSYVGPCLPYCRLPSDCAITCEYGLIPAGAVGEGCFECQCMGAPGDNRPFQCAITPPDPNATAQSLLARVRTFTDPRAADAAGFHPNFGDTCPSSICTDAVDCRGLDAVLEADLAGIAGTPDSVTVTCDRIGQSPTRACRAVEVLTADACDCLERPGAGVYDPVCGTLNGASRTFYNLCTATCLGAFPVLYPGECCETRMTISDRSAQLDSLTTFCSAQGQGRVPRLFTETACPPSLAECQASSDKDLCCTLAPVRGGGPKQPVPP